MSHRVLTQGVRVAWALLIGFAGCANLGAQNVVEDRSRGPVAPPIQITEAQALAIVDFTAAPPRLSTNREARRIAAKLDRHVSEFLRGGPWMPFHHTLGISGYEVYFNHPDQMFYAVSLALPHLPPATAAHARTFLAAQLNERPPYGGEGMDNRTGRPRESYAVPPALRVNEMGRARSAFGVYAFWAYIHATSDERAAREHWKPIRERMQTLLNETGRFDPTRRDYQQDEAEILNGNLAALIATVRLARTNGDPATAQKALLRLKEMLESRVNLERVNPKILEATQSSTKHLHVSKLSRFCDLTREVGEAVRTLTDGCGSARLKNFREARNGWHLAFGDRMIGGENYTNPPHFSRALFAGAVFVEQLPPEQIASFVDVPWCKGDFYFMEKCALALSVMP
jgi:hypothetical protein